jgi:hypothetical protein
MSHPFPYRRSIAGHHITYGNQPLFVGVDDDTAPNAANAGVLEPIDETHAAVKKPNGKYLSLLPNGTYGEADAIGDYERFTLDEKFMLFGATYVQSDGSAAGVPIKLWVCYVGA